MSAVSRALEIWRESVQEEAIHSSPVGRLGPPIWRAEQPVQGLQFGAGPGIPVELLALVLLQTGRSS